MKNYWQDEAVHTVGRVLVVDDESELASALCEMLTAHGYETARFLSASEALAALDTRSFDLLLTDLMMPGTDGIALIRAALARDPDLICIVMTGHGTVESAVEAMKSGAFDYILKPFKRNALLPVLTRAMQVRSLRQENMQLKETVAIHELGKAVSFSSDLGTILNKVADAVLQQCSADEVSIMLPTKGGRELYVAAVRGGQLANLGVHAPVEQGIAGWVARNREPVVLRGRVDDPQMAPIRPRSDIHTAVSIPMLSQSRLVGVLNVNITKSHRQFTLGQLKALGVLVSIITPVLENTTLNIRIRTAEEMYRSIVENAPCGIFRLSPQGELLSVNPAFSRIFGHESPEGFVAEAADFFRQVHADPDRGDHWVRQIEAEGEVRNFEFEALRRDGSLVWVSFNGRAVCDEQQQLLYFEGMAEEITGRKKSEARQALARDILELLNRPSDLKPLIRGILARVKLATGAGAVAIRLMEGEDYPYFVTDGFSADFLASEKSLLMRDEAGAIVRDEAGAAALAGRCGNVLCGRTDPARPYFTKNGSFWTGALSRLPGAEDGEIAGCSSNRCGEQEGFESHALIPLHSGDKVIGLLQLCDRRPRRFSDGMIRFLEGIGASVGIAIAQRRAIEELRESEKKYRLHFENVTDIVYSLAPDLTLRSVSPSVERLLGYPPAELAGRPLAQLPLLAEEGRRQTAADLQTVLAGGTVPARVHVFVARDGRTATFEVASAPMMRAGRTEAALFVARDISERIDAERRIAETIERLRQSVDDTVRVMARIVEQRDPYTAGHQERVAALSAAIARELGLSDETVRGIRIAGMIHDIGKMAVPSEILSKPTLLSPIEIELIRSHADSGHAILREISFPDPVAEICHQHHERFNGDGYPRGLRGEGILIEARILAVADVVEAMASHRPYRPGLGIEVALGEIEKNRGVLYDAAVVDACLRLIREKGYRIS